MALVGFFNLAFDNNLSNKNELPKKQWLAVAQSTLAYHRVNFLNIVLLTCKWLIGKKCYEVELDNCLIT